MIQMLQTAPAGPGGVSPALSQFVLMGSIFAIFYFLLIMPMRKKQKKVQQMLSKLKKGDEVIASGGIFGRITAIDDERGFVILQISDNTKVKVLRSAIAALASEPEAAKPEAGG